MSYLVLDIETVGDNLPVQLEDKLFKNIEPDGRLKDPDKIIADIAKKQDEIRAEYGLSPLTCKIVCIGVAGNDVTARVLHSESESELIKEFFGTFNVKRQYTIVTFNGSQFDIPILRLKAIQHGVANLIFPFRRYPDNQLDLRDLVTNFDKRGKGTLHQWCLRFDIPVPQDQISGKEVQQAYNEGRIKDICDHCLTDVGLTEALYQKFTGVRL